MNGPETDSESTVHPHHLFWLAALALAAAFLTLEPLATFSLFGSDTGEYFRLTQAALSTGRIPTTGYAGWGTAYPDFPGIFALSAGAAGGLGMDALSALVLVVPLVAAASVFPMFLLFRRLVPQPTLAIVGAGFAALFVPRLFSIAHPAPLALGDFFVIGSLWMFVEGRRDVRWYLPLALVAAAMMVTHHLSSYFFLVSALGGLLALELWRPGTWSRRFPTRELAFLGGFAALLLVYWLVFATAFRTTVLSAGFGGIGRFVVVPAVALAVLGVVVAGLVIRWRRAHPPKVAIKFRMPSDRSVARDMALILTAELVGATAVIFVPVPGTNQTTLGSAVVYFVPVFAAIVLAAGSRRLVTASRLGPFAIVWLAALSLSTIVAIAANNQVLSPYRHTEYLVIPLGLLIAVGLGHLIARLSDTHVRRSAIAASVAVVALLAANAAVVYPPPADFGGFQEGLTHQDAALWIWVGLGVPTWAVVASDHRLSSMIFGFDGNPATWDSTPGLFTGSTWTAAAAELTSSYAPHTYRSINVVAVDTTMRSGVALNPSDLAKPMSSDAIVWLAEPPFVPLYENGLQVVYWVDGPIPAVP